MTTYIYFVKCPGCEDEHFDLFNEAKEFALGRLTKKPIITQVEVCRNDFGECTDSADLGTVWSWEDIMGNETETEPTESIFTKDDLKCVANGQDPEFDNLDNSVDYEIEESKLTEASPVDATRAPKDSDYVIVLKNPMNGRHTFFGNNYRMTADLNKAMTYPGKFSAQDDIKYAADQSVQATNDPDDFYYENNFFVTTVAEAKKLLGKYEDRLQHKARLAERKPIPEGMTIEQIVEEMEENEDTVECTLCNDLFDKSTCRKELNLGWLCRRCADDLVARGEGPVFKEDNYWDFLDEKLDLDIDFSNCVDSSDMEIWGLEHTQEDFYKAVLLKRFTDVSFKGPEDEVQKVVDEMYDIDGMLTFSFDKAGLPVLNAWNVNLLRKLGSINIEFEDPRYEDAAAAAWGKTPVREELGEPHDLGNTYDGGYPKEKPLLPEIDEVTDSDLRTCPECGKKAFDTETGICIECGFN